MFFLPFFLTPFGGIWIALHSMNCVDAYIRRRRSQQRSSDWVDWIIATWVSPFSFSISPKQKHSPIWNITFVCGSSWWHEMTSPFGYLTDGNRLPTKLMRLMMYIYIYSLYVIYGLWLYGTVAGQDGAQGDELRLEPTMLHCPDTSTQFDVIVPHFHKLHSVCEKPAQRSSLYTSSNAM